MKWVTATPLEVFMQQMRYSSFVNLAVCLILGLAGATWAGVSGKIVGTVTDAQSGDPVPGASVVVEGLRMGAVADSDGRYFIMNVPAGRYTVKSQLVGFTTTSKQGVRVRADLTTRVNFSLSAEAIEVGEIVVTAERRLIERTRVSTSRTTLREQLEFMPVTDARAIYRSAPGVVFDEIGGPMSAVTDGTIRMEVEARTGNSQNPGISVRGSRPAEERRYIDNIANGTPLPSAAVEETNFMPGGFGATYGNGVAIINTVTPTPGAQYDVGFAWESDVLPGLVDERYDYGTNISTIDFGGPIPGTNNALRVWAMFNTDVRDDWGPKLHTQDAEFIEDGIREFIDRDNMNEAAQSFWRDSINGDAWDVFSGNSLVLPNHDQDVYTGMGKVLWKVGPIQLQASALVWRRQYGRYSQNSLFTSWDHNQNYRGLPTLADVALSTYEDRVQYTVGGNWAINPRTIIEMKASFSERTYILASKDIENGSDGLFDDYDFPWHEYATDWSPFKLAAGDTASRAQFQRRRSEVYYPLGVTNLFFTGGNSRACIAQDRSDMTFRLDGTSQVTNHHEVKLGMEFIKTEFAQDRLSDPTSGSPFFDQYGYFNPVYMAGWVQDKIEYEGMTITAGLRFDYFDPDASVWSDPLKPGAGSTMPDGSVNTNGRADLNSDPTGNAYRDVEVDAKTAISPRLGISHPVSDRALLYFNYGHYRTVPALTELYETYAPDLGRANSRLGNPDLPMYKTVSYEVGYTQQMAANTKLDVVFYYKNLSNMPSYERIPAMNGAYTYAMATVETPVGDDRVNIGYGYCKGMELMLTKLPDTGFFSGWVSYSYLNSNVIYSGQNDAYERFTRSALDPQTGELANPPDMATTADFDRAHAFKGNLDFRLPANFGPQVAGMYPLQNAGMNVMQSVNGGLPYTRIDQDGDPVGIENEFRRPWTYQTDVRFDKSFYFGQSNQSRLNVYVNIENLFDTRNVQNVYERTGNAEDDGKTMPQAQPNSLTPDDATWVYEGVKDGIDGSAPDGAISINEDEVAYRKAYSLYARDPLFFMTPRVIRVGLSLSF